MRLPILTVFTFGLTVGTSAFACPGKTATASASAAETSVASLDASACAKKASLVGSSCSYSTGMMASRVLEQGKSFSYTGTLTPMTEKLESRVAAPFVLGPDKVRVIANEVVESIDDTATRLTYQGKLLEVDGVSYFVVTQFDDASA